MLVPADRGELSGPFFQNIFELNRTPFYPSDFSGEGREAGRFGRDEGINIWGGLGPEQRLTYVAGEFRGHRVKGDLGRGPLYAARLSYNFWNVEQNPGYYTAAPIMVLPAISLLWLLPFNMKKMVLEHLEIQPIF